MDITEARRSAQTLIDAHLSGWRFEWDNSKTRFGMCSYSTRTLSFSIHLTKLRDESAFVNTVLHEIAHALTPGENHNSVWRQKCISIGGDGARCSDDVKIEGEYEVICRSCERVVGRAHRKIKLNGRYHKPCGPQSSIYLKKNGQYIYA